MRKLFLVALMVFAAVTAGLAQQGQSSSASQGGEEIPNMGRAPRALDGIGRLDLRVVDMDGNPVKGVHAELESRRLNGMFCESWHTTDTRGVAVLPPIHMGRLTLKLKAPGYETQKIQVDPNGLDQPLRVTMNRKK
ncbi:MAG TPA: hypothetical protein VF666_09480 [Pyrinomonadaceae bacterium]|jgi:hypothetical protein